MRILKTVALLLLAVTLLRVSYFFVFQREISTAEYFERVDSNVIPVWRTRFFFPREFHVQGIWPLEGQIMSDPHFEKSDLVSVMDPVSGLQFDYQSFAVNPWFDNPEHKESVFAVRKGDDVFEYPAGGFLSHNFFTMPKHFLFLFSSKNALFFYSGHRLNEKGSLDRIGAFLVVFLPFESRKSIIFSPRDAEKWSAFMDEYSELVAIAPSVKTLCGTKWKPNIAFLSHLPAEFCQTP